MTRRHPIITRTILLTTLAVLAACTQADKDAAGKKDAGASAADAAKAAVVATVNGKDLTQAVLDEFVQAATGQPAAQATPEQRTELLDRLIDMTLVAQAADKEGLGNGATVKARLDLVRTQLLAEAASEKYSGAHPVSDSEVQAEYDSVVKGLPKEYKARHILVDKKEDAEAIIKDLQGGGDFSKLATAKSKDSSAAGGGDLGWFSPQTMVKPFADAVTALQKGQYTQTPVQTEFGYHVIILDDLRSSEAPPLEDVKDRVKLMVQRKKLQTYVEELRKTAKIQKTS